MYSLPASLRSEHDMSHPLRPLRCDQHFRFYF